MAAISKEAHAKVKAERDAALAQVAKLKEQIDKPSRIKEIKDEYQRLMEERARMLTEISSNKESTRRLTKARDDAWAQVHILRQIIEKAMQGQTPIAYVSPGPQFPRLSHEEAAERYAQLGAARDQHGR